MSSSNKTSNYNLSQYIGTDKPTYLGDYNSDMSKIDGQMKTNNSLAAAADSKADINTGNIGNLSNLNTTEKQSLVGAVNEVNTKAGAIGDLSTTDKTNLVAAVNEVNSTVSTNSSSILTNTNSIGVLNNLNTTTKTSLVAAVNETYANNTYTESEQAVGKWIDGRVLYRKVLKATFSSYTSSNYFTLYPNIQTTDKIVMMQGCINRASGQTNPTGSLWDLVVTNENATIRAIDNQNFFAAGDIFYVVIEYVKALT